MKVIVPLAGPDFVTKDGITKGEAQYLGGDLLHKILRRRPWYGSVLSCDYIFILQDKIETKKLAEEKLKVWFPQCKLVFLSHVTGGAAFSAVASLPYISNGDDKIIIDLADIDYELSEAIIPEIRSMNESDAIAVTFNSKNPIYSYLLFDQAGEFIESKEKQVISAVASAGTYIFGSHRSFFNAFQYSLKTKSMYLHNGLMYVCPLFNGVKANSGMVKKVDVSHVFDVKAGE